MKYSNLQYNPDNVMYVSSIKELKRFFRKLGMELHTTKSKPGQFKLGEKRTYSFWCNTSTSRNKRGAVVVVKAKDNYKFRIKED